MRKPAATSHPRWRSQSPQSMAIVEYDFAVVFKVLAQMAGLQNP
jgi:hypothetical protein